VSITITKADQSIPVTNITILAFGQPGSGKTSLAFTAKRPILLDFDGGAYRSEYRKDSVQIRTWEDIMGLTADDLAPYDTVVVDTVGRLLDALSIYIVQQNPKMGRGTGALTLQGYGELKAAYAGWLKTLLSYGKDVVLIAHDREEKDNDTLIVRPDIQGGSYSEVFKRADGIAYMYRGVKGTILDFNPSEKWVGKNAGQLPALAVPHFSTTPNFLAGIISLIKNKLNAMSQQDDAAKAEVEAWRQRFAAIATAEALTAIVSEASKTNGVIGAQVKAMLSERAKALNLKWEGLKGKGKYVKDHPIAA
jgi:hypothetical protein